MLDFLSFLVLIGFRLVYNYPFPKKAQKNNFFSNKRNFFDVKFFNLTTYYS
jgi:hypothetical protein